MKLDNLLNILKIDGYRITEQRKAILEVLVLNNNNLISVEDIHDKSKKIYPKTNMSTVYRNLEILKELNVIYAVFAENGTTLYKLICSSEHHHHHIICKNCGKTEVINFCPLDTFKKLSKDKNFNLTDHKIELYGYCIDCQKLKDL